MKYYSIILSVLLLICFASVGDVSAQNALPSEYLSSLKNNLAFLFPEDEAVKNYCKAYETNINLLFVEDDKIKIGNEEYDQNEIVQEYYNGFQSFQYINKCRFLFAWSKIESEVVIEAELKNSNKELALIPICISKFEKYHLTSAGGYGLWGLQYIPAVRYGLTADSCYDERLDLKKSTSAAISYLNLLHDSFGSWDYAITAYVCGAPKLRKAMANTHDFDSAIKNLDAPEKYTFYILLALVRWMGENETINPAKYTEENHINCDTVIINKRLHVDQIAGVLDIKSEDLKFLNPLFIGNIIDGRLKPKTYYLPLNYKDKFIAHQDSICSYKDSIYFPKYKPVTVTETSNDYQSSESYVSISPGDDYEEIKYKIVSGDNLGFIAEKFNVKVQDIKNWNNISGTNIYAGQQISIWIKKGTGQTILIKQNEQKSEITSNTIKVPENVKLIYDLKDYTYVETYTVKSGDSPYKIAKNYTWASAEEIMAWNNISDPSKMQIGQKLKIYKKK